MNGLELANDGLSKKYIELKIKLESFNYEIERSATVKAHARRIVVLDKQLTRMKTIAFVISCYAASLTIYALWS